MKKGQSAAEYKMQKDGWLDYFELHVSKTKKEMREHIEACFKEWACALPTDGWGETAGLCHPVHSLDGPFAYLFLNEENLGVGVVAHECLHVAMAHERFVLRFGMSYGNGEESLEDEERLAYFLTSCVRGCYDTLYEHKHIKEKE